MTALAIIIAAAALAFWQLRRVSPLSRTTPLAAPKASPQLVQLIEFANRLYAERKWIAAEKTYLSILRLDHKNVSAYSHLGIIYSTQKNMADAIECFEIAARLKPSAGTYQNLALGFYENKNYVKAAAAFDKAIMFEPTASRYIGLSKARKQLADADGTVRALQKAAELEPRRRILQLLEQAYVDAKWRDEAKLLRERIAAMEPDEERSTPRSQAGHA